MTNENKTRLLDKFLKDYPFNYETEYNTLFNKRKYMRDNEYHYIAKLFDDFQDYIIDFFTSEI